MATTDINLKTVAQLYEIKKNQIKMAMRRGYQINPAEIKNVSSFDHFMRVYIPHAEKNQITFRSALTNVYANTDGRPSFVAYYADVDPKTTLLGKGELSGAIEYMRQYKIKDGIVITKKLLSPSASSTLESLLTFNIQIFLEEEMSYDPTEHFLVPTHIPLSDEEQTKFLNENDITIDKLPIIPTKDIIARYYGLRPGQIVRIERENMYESIILKSVAYKAIMDK